MKRSLKWFLHGSLEDDDCNIVLAARLGEPP